MQQNDQNDFYFRSFTTPDFHLPLFTHSSGHVGPKASVIIGSNGTNKSRALSQFIDELEHLDALRRTMTGEQQSDQAEAIGRTNQKDLFYAKRRRSRPLLHNRSETRFDARFEYRMAGSDWVLERTGDSLDVWRNGDRFASSDFSFPDRAIAVAHLPTDRFPFKINRHGDFYSYLGLRQNYNMTTTGALETKVAVGLLESIKRTRAPNIFKKWFEELELDGPVKIRIATDHSSLARMETQQQFEVAAFEAYSRLERRRRDLPPQRIKEIAENTNKLWRFYSELKQFSLDASSNERKYRARYYEVSLEVDELSRTFEDFDIAEMLSIGRRVRLFADISMVVSKRGQEVRFSDLSSGEQQVLGTIIRFVAELGECSAVVIDEPEVSLHPVWQKMYLPRLLETLQAFPNTHAIIATHSHFLVSDVSEKSASLTIADTKHKGLFRSFEGNVYGRSAENILYRVFGIGGTSNFYVERDLTKALRMISGVDDLNMETLQTLYSRLQVVNEPDNEALMEILRRIEIVLKGDS